jgi:hypothetical protein
MNNTSAPTTATENQVNGKLTPELFEAASIPVTDTAKVVSVGINPDKAIAKPFKQGGSANTAAVMQPVTPAAVPGRSSRQSSLNQIPRNTELDKLARRFRDSRKDDQEAGAALLHHILDAGDALNEAQEQVLTGWKRWLKDNCFVSVRTAFVYQQLANHREEIETALSQAGELSMRAALRLISKPKEDGKKEPRSELTAVMAGMTDDELTAQLPVALPFERFLQILSADWRAKIESRLSKRPHEVTAEAFIRASEVLRRALMLVKIAATPGITPVVAASNEKEAIAALRGLNTMLAGAGIDEVTVVHQHAKERRCVRQRRRRTA